MKVEKQVECLGQESIKEHEEEEAIDDDLKFLIRIMVRTLLLAKNI